MVLVVLRGEASQEELALGRRVLVLMTVHGKLEVQELRLQASRLFSGQNQNRLSLLLPSDLMWLSDQQGPLVSGALEPDL